MGVELRTKAQCFRVQFLGGIRLGEKAAWEA